MAEQTQLNNLPAIKEYFSSNGIRKKFEELLKEKAAGFISSLMQCVNNSDLLSKADIKSIYGAAITAAALDLPINPSLGVAYIVPYKGQAQFQIGYKGFVQLAQRSGQYEKINVITVYENQFTSYDQLSEELIADFTKDGDGKIVGYCAYFKLVGGMSKREYWSREKVLKHALKFSKSFQAKKGTSLWEDPEQFDAMAKKTVLKNTLSKWGILSIDIQRAVILDQSVIEDPDNPQYPDNSEESNEDKAAAAEKAAQAAMSKK